MSARLAAPSTQDAARARFARDGVLWPLPALSATEAAAYCACLRPWLDGDGRAGAGLRNSPHLLLRWAADLVRHPAVLDAVAAQLGPDLLVLRSTLFVKSAGDAGVVGWHQDGLYWDLDGPQVLTAWIALTDSTAANGAVEFAPGSQRGGARPHALDDDAHGRLLRGQIAPPAPGAATQVVELRAGEFSLHDVWILHRSGPNPSRQPRVGMAVRYMAPAVRQRGVAQVAMLVRGQDRFGHHPLAAPPRADADAAARAEHRRSLRRYALQVVWQAARRPTLAHLRLLGRLARRRELRRAALGRLPAGAAGRGAAPPA